MKLFLSYDRDDAELVDKVVAGLTSEGFEVWIDRESIIGGDQWRRQIVDAVDSCEAFLILLSNYSVQSANVRKELDLAEGKEKRVIPVTLQRISLPPEFEYQLAGLQMIDLSDDFQVGMGDLVRALQVEDPSQAGPASHAVYLEDVGPRKIEVIKVVREMTDLGLKETKDLVESAPVEVWHEWSQRDAQAWVKQLRKAGATASVRQAS